MASSSHYLRFPDGVKIAMAVPGITCNYDNILEEGKCVHSENLFLSLRYILPRSLLGTSIHVSMASMFHVSKPNLTASKEKMGLGLLLASHDFSFLRGWGSPTLKHRITRCGLDTRTKPQIH